MSQITEQSIKEVGTIKIVKLSDKKVRLDYMGSIICQEKVIQDIKFKVRYRLDDEDGIYKMYYPKPGFLNILSNKLRVKKKSIHYGELFNPKWILTYKLDTGKSFELEGLKFNNLIKSIYISDEEWFKSWNRENQLKELLK